MMLRTLAAVTAAVAVVNSALIVRAQEDGLSRDLKMAAELMKAGELADAEAVLKRALPSPLAEPPKQPGGLNISVYGFSWAMLITVHLNNFDLDSAARIATERIQAAEEAIGKNHLAVAGFLNMLGSIRMRQGKFEAATAAFERSLVIHKAAGLADQVAAAGVYEGLAECLVVQNRVPEAQALLQPTVQKMREESRLSLGERLANVYAVALRENGAVADAEELEGFIENKSLFRPGVNEQQRDLLRARASAARGDFAAAEKIYLKWIEHWERWGESAGELEWDRVLMRPLEHYGDFLALAGREEDAASIRRRLADLRTKY